MANKPVWITPAGNLGTIPENTFYKVPLEAEAFGDVVRFQLIAGDLPEGMQLRQTGTIEGTAKAVADVQGLPLPVNRDVVSRFAVRAYTESVVGGVTTTRISDRTFSITVSGQDIPDFVTPAGQIGEFIDGTLATIPIEFTDQDPGDRVRVNILSGSLPPGLVLNSSTGVISGLILPLSLHTASKSFSFVLEITDGKDSNVRAFSILVYARNEMTADTIDASADSTFITADINSTRPPVLLTPAGDLGVARADNFYAFKFDAIDFDGDPIEYSIGTGAGVGFDEAPYDSFPFDKGNFSLPPGLSINPDTGWFYGYIPDQGAVDFTYQFAVSVHKKDAPEITSPISYFTITIIGDLDTQVIWLTPADLGYINNGAASTLYVEAYNTGGRELIYQITPGSTSKLPQGLTLQPSGNITGRVSFNTFALDGGTTTFDKTNKQVGETTFDLEFNFTVNAYSPLTSQLGYQVSYISVSNGGSGYTSQPTITIEAPPETADSIPATAGLAVIEDGVITAIAVGNPGRGYVSAPAITIEGGGGNGAQAIALMREIDQTNAVSVYRTFTIKVVREFNQPYQSLYIKAMPPYDDRALVSELLNDTSIIPTNLLYRADDPNFGIAKSVTYVHAYGLTPSTLELYVSSLNLNHYWKNLTLGEIKTAQALDANGNVLYEVVYSQIIDDLVNQSGESVGKSVNLAYDAYTLNGAPVSTVYPNSLFNMREQVVDTVGQVSPALPLWMTSKQANGRVLGFVPAWVIAYIKPGESGRVAYNIRTKFSKKLNLVDFEVDRYELDRSQTLNWDPVTNHWIPYPPTATTFDNNTTVFEGGATDFTAPADTWIDTDAYNKYLLFPNITIIPTTINPTVTWTNVDLDTIRWINNYGATVQWTGSSI